MKFSKKLFNKNVVMSVFVEDIHDWKNYDEFNNDIFNNLVRVKGRKYGHVVLYVPYNGDGLVYQIELSHGGYKMDIVDVLVPIRRVREQRALVVLNKPNKEKIIKRAKRMLEVNPKSSDWNYFNSLMYGKDFSKKTNHKHHTCATLTAWLLGYKGYQYFHSDKLVETLLNDGNKWLPHKSKKT